MRNATLTVWCSINPKGAAARLLREGIGRHRLLLPAFSLSPGERVEDGTDPLLDEADVVFGQLNPQRLMELPKLRWFHVSSAGYTPYDREDLKARLKASGAMMTNSSNVYDEPCALHLLAMITALARQLPAAHDSQRAARGWPHEPLRAASRLLAGEMVLILGFGAIARRLVELLTPLGMNIIGARRRIRGGEPISMIAEEEIDQYLPSADHVVNILPANAETIRFFNGERFALMKPGSYFYNIGRGTTVDTDALIASLESSRIAAAYLDVTDPEPLPPGHPLWTAANCYITPHTAGGHAREAEMLVSHFLDNLNRFVAGQPLVNRIV